MDKTEKKLQIIDFIENADEADLCVIAALAMGYIAAAHSSMRIKFKVRSPLMTSECTLTQLPPSSKVGMLSVSEIQNCEVTKHEIKALYSEFLKQKEGGEK